MILKIVGGGGNLLWKGRYSIISSFFLQFLKFILPKKVLIMFLLFEPAPKSRKMKKECFRPNLPHFILWVNLARTQNKLQANYNCTYDIFLLYLVDQFHKNSQKRQHFCSYNCSHATELLLKWVKTTKLTETLTKTLNFWRFVNNKRICNTAVHKNSPQEKRGVHKK